MKQPYHDDNEREVSRLSDLTFGGASSGSGMSLIAETTWYTVASNEKTHVWYESHRNQHPSQLNNSRSLRLSKLNLVCLCHLEWDVQEPAFGVEYRWEKKASSPWRELYSGENSEKGMQNPRHRAAAASCTGCATI